MNTQIICLVGSSERVLTEFRSLLQDLKSESKSSVSAQDNEGIVLHVVNQFVSANLESCRSCILVSDGDQSRLLVSNSARFGKIFNYSRRCWFFICAFRLLCPFCLVLPTQKIFNRAQRFIATIQDKPPTRGAQGHRPNRRGPHTDTRPRRRRPPPRRPRRRGRRPRPRFHRPAAWQPPCPRGRARVSHHGSSSRAGPRRRRPRSQLARRPLPRAAPLAPRRPGVVHLPRPPPRACSAAPRPRPRRRHCGSVGRSVARCRNASAPRLGRKRRSRRRHRNCRRSGCGRGDRGRRLRDGPCSPRVTNGKASVRRCSRPRPAQTEPSRGGDSPSESTLTAAGPALAPDGFKLEHGAACAVGAIPAECGVRDHPGEQPAGCGPMVCRFANYGTDPTCHAPRRVRLSRAGVVKRTLRPGIESDMSTRRVWSSVVCFSHPSACWIPPSCARNPSEPGQGHGSNVPREMLGSGGAGEEVLGKISP